MRFDAMRFDAITSRYGTRLYGAWVFGLSSEASDTAAEPPRCSAKGCRAQATEDLSWRNPRIHDAARVKHWLACPQHGDFLADFLARRGFLLSRDPVSTIS